MALAAALFFDQAPPVLRADPPIKCDVCDEWNQPREPFRIFGNAYFVGTAGLSAILIASDRGHILLDGGLSQSAPVIDANIRKLGFKTEDVKLIVNSHGHYDHAAGIAALQRLSGAIVAATASGAEALQRGENTTDDPQFGFGHDANAFPPVKNVRVVKDKEVIEIAGLAIQAHDTAGHTPGSTTWTWRSCEGTRCLNLVYADSLTPVSAPGFRFTGDAKTPSRVEKFRQSIATVAALPCDIVISTHPGATNLDGKLKRRLALSESGGRASGTLGGRVEGADKPAVDPLIDPNGCRVLAAIAAKQLDARVAEETAKK
jgi:metallo-beta-lactamase class B